MQMHGWRLLNELVRVKSQWITLIGERWLCDQGNELEYWRVEKDDSVIVLPIQAGQIFCVKPTFRVGIHRSTLDFPGGRLPGEKKPKEIVPMLLERELCVPPTAISAVFELNKTKWIVNSSFSNQGLWGFIVEIDPAFAIPQSCIGARVKADNNGISELMTQLDCLQCRSVLLEWQHQTRN